MRFFVLLFIFFSYQIRIGFSDGCNSALLHHEVVGLMSSKTLYFRYCENIQWFLMISFKIHLQFYSIQSLRNHGKPLYSRCGFFLRENFGEKMHILVVLLLSTHKMRCPRSRIRVTLSAFYSFLDNTKCKKCTLRLKEDCKICITRAKSCKF